MAMDDQDIDPMSSIFHEKQEGSLCAQHCLNALLQGNYFTAVDLGEIGRGLDEVERQQMAEAGTQSDEYMRFMQQPSSNYDDSGFFSIQVIQKAVSVWSLELVPFTSSAEEATRARENPRTQQAYICNFREHWFTIRKLGNQWFNLNSLLTHPELVSDTYLSLFLTQLQQEGYSIFLVLGKLPDCEADQILKVVPAVQPIKPRLLPEAKSKPSDAASVGQYEDPELQMALEESKRLAEEDDQSLKRALAMSMEGLPEDFAFPQYNPGSSHHPVLGSSQSQNISTESGTNAPANLPEPNKEDLRGKRLAFFENKPAPEVNKGSSGAESEGAKSGADVEKDSQQNVDNKSTCTETKDTDDNTNISEYSEEKMLELALKMSMEGDT